MTKQVLSSINRVVPGDVCRRLADALPPELGAAVRDDCVPDDLIDSQAFIGPLVNNMATMYGYDHSLGGIDLVSVYLDDDASRQVRAVFGALQRMLDSNLQSDLERHLPPEVADWWRDAR